MAPASQAKRNSAPVFMRLQGRDARLVETLRLAVVEAAFGGEIEHLAADHAAEA